ncbi:MAG: nucleoside kinase, partial [Erysipelotrichaceae bacterium]|nr:nucleoside kinase [Erysipelotrichaceae bacterium]
IDHHNRIPTTDARMLRRLVRDHQFRGRSPQTVLDEWVKVRKSENVNIFPYNSEADVFFNSNCLYELAVLKKYAEPLLKSIQREEPQYAEALRMLNLLRYIDEIPDDSAIVNNSIMREFIGGSIIVD